MISCPLNVQNKSTCEEDGGCTKQSSVPNCVRFEVGKVWEKAGKIINVLPFFCLNILNQCSVHQIMAIIANVVT